MEPFDDREKNGQPRFFPFSLSPGWRLVLALIAAILVIWGITALMDSGGVTSAEKPPLALKNQSPSRQAESLSGQNTGASSGDKTGAANISKIPEAHQPSASSVSAPAQETADQEARRAAAHASSPSGNRKSAKQKQTPSTSTTVEEKVAGVPSKKAAGSENGESAVPRVTGVAFVNAVSKPIRYELEERFYGWRPNDLIRFTDNVNNFQRGVLEVTRRAVVKLAERISRTGSTDILDKNLEPAMNWFMVSGESFWFPAAENKYKDGLKELAAYRDRLINGEADFYTRTDNLIPLFKAFADLVGSCDENLVKTKEKDGQSVSTFAADNYFYYAKGVASAMEPILRSVEIDFHDTLMTRGAITPLHHAIHACHTAANLEPLIVFEADLDGFLANHRANMAAHISHARFHLDVLVNTLST